MRFTAAFLALIIASSAFTIPEGQADGVYAVNPGVDGGEAVHVRVGDLHSPDEVTRSVDEAKPAGGGSARDVSVLANGVSCKSDHRYALPPHKTDRAVTTLRAQCRGGGADVPHVADYYSIQGSVFAFFCNFGAGNTRCRESEIASSLARVTDVCGRYKPGWQDFQTSSRWISIGYDYALDKVFCGRRH